MKIENPNAGALTNWEVLDFLRSRGASKDPTRVIAHVAPSEYKVYDYLAMSAACNQTREQIVELVEKSQRFKLAKAEILNIINLRPSNLVEIYPIIEAVDQRLGDEVKELVSLVNEVLPPRPNHEQEMGDQHPSNDEMADAVNTESVLEAVNENADG